MTRVGRAAELLARARSDRDLGARRLARFATVLVGLSATALGLVVFVLAETTHVPPALRGSADWRGDAVFVPSGDPGNQRTLRGVAIVKESRARLLVIAGAGTVGDSSAYLGGIAHRAGLPDSSIVLEGASTNTWDNFVFSRPLLEQHDIHRMLIVTNRSHARRALQSAHAALPGIDAMVEPVDDDPVPTYIRVLEVGKTVHQIRAGHLPPSALYR